jgi:hypothetical protein
MPIKFFYLPRGKKYNYIPRYYDEQKEELEKRKRVIDAELKREGKEGLEDDIYIPNIKGKMRSHMKAARKQKRNSNIRMVVILAFLLLLSYLILFA